MSIADAAFKAYFSGSFWKKLKESVVPFKTDEIPSSKEDFLTDLCKDINAKKYFPSHPREYIVSNKHNDVSRIIPTFQYKESCVYYFCVKELESFIAVNHVEGTFGGWTLGNLIKSKEEADLATGEYSPPGSFNPFKWQENWKDFQKKAYQYSLKKEFAVVVEFDIANFYDSINLSILESKIRHVTDKTKSFVVDLMFCFLGNWNRIFEHYSLKKVGIPQDEIGDCSRILANFYLQDYDAFMKIFCNKNKAVYLRYADDQLVYAPDLETAKSILFEASKELFKINLNINSSKVKIFDNKKDFYTYWAFDIFELLGDGEDKTKINEAISIYFERRKSKVKFRESSVLKRILSLNFSDIKPEFRQSLLEFLLEPNFLCDLDYWAFIKLRERIDDPKKLYAVLDPLIDKVKFNSFHFNLLGFYKKYRKDGPIEKIEERIKTIALSLHQ